MTTKNAEELLTSSYFGLLRLTSKLCLITSSYFVCVCSYFALLRQNQKKRTNNQYSKK